MERDGERGGRGGGGRGGGGGERNVWNVMQQVDVEHEQPKKVGENV